MQLQYGGGWILNQGTSSSYALSAVKRGLIAVTTFGILIAAVGTGGQMTVNYLVNRNEVGYKFNQVRSTAFHQGAIQRTPEENLAHIREILKPSISELGTVLGVSRQAIYDWQNGNPVAPENATRLGDIAKAADIFVAEGVVVTPYILKRPISGGKTLFEIIRDGGIASHAARSLTQLVLGEINRRKALNIRLANRKQEMDYQDMGSPMLNERA